MASTDHEGRSMRKNSAAIRNALLLLACIVVFLAVAAIFASKLG
ncbi:MAG: hypothetical protein WD078_11450 [Woeseia sp.]